MPPHVYLFLRLAHFDGISWIIKQWKDEIERQQFFLVFYYFSNLWPCSITWDLFCRCDFERTVWVKEKSYWILPEGCRNTLGIFLWLCSVKANRFAPVTAATRASGTIRAQQHWLRLREPGSLLITPVIAARGLLLNCSDILVPRVKTVSLQWNLHRSLKPKHQRLHGCVA